MNIINVYNCLFSKLLELNKQLPRSCFLCTGKIPNSNQGLCPACLDDFPLNRIACDRCGNELPKLIESNEPIEALKEPTTYIAPRICGECMKTPPAWHTLNALCQYDYPASNMIQSLKYNAQFANAKILSQLFLSKLKSELEKSPDTELPQCIMPVPLHPKRQKQRGFNQAIELARPIAKALAIPLDIESCIRQTDTPSQAGLDKLLRLQNLVGAFVLKQIPPYKHIVIFDDVVTTGNTVRSLCKLLHKAGIEKVDVWCIARASKPN